MYKKKKKDLYDKCIFQTYEKDLSNSINFDSQINNSLDNLSINDSFVSASQIGGKPLLKSSIKKSVVV
jgi:hypothetical protein